LDLPPEETREYKAGSIFRESGYRDRITQLFGDSRSFDFTAWYGTVDLVLIDANHTYPFVKTDSENALRLVRPGGLVLWDDYVWLPEYPGCIGVAEYLHELSRSKQCFQIEGTRFAAHMAADLSDLSKGNTAALGRRSPSSAT
jgi:predicted O-methyltransferase YrrM